MNMIRNIENATLPDFMQQGRHMLHLLVTTVARLRETGMFGLGIESAALERYADC
jgi:hypothetical protein